MTCDNTKPSWPRRIARDRTELSEGIAEILKRTDDQDRAWALQEFVEERLEQATKAMPRPAIIPNEAPGT